MRSLKSRYYAVFFVAVSVLILAQVGWWAFNFLEEVSTIASLRSENLRLAAQLENQPVAHSTLQLIADEAARRRVMFISESSFFALLTVWALYLLYRALRREERSRSLEKSFIQAVSHDSKTPLTALKLRLEDVRDQLTPASELRIEVEGALEEVRRLISGFERMLTLNRTERESLALQPVNLVEVIESVLKRLSPFLKSHGAEIIFSLPVEAEVRGDSTGLATSVQCLIENSILHNPSGVPKVWMDLASESGVKNPHWVLRIRDNGPGIPLSERRIIFEKFSRGTRSGGISGTGLGLYIARKTAEAHHGSLRLSDSSDEGSCFELVIPAVPT
jgi:signal transduction histidine kinase